MDIAIQLKNISKSYNGIQVLKDVNLEIRRGEFTGIRGESGSGKSTLLNIIGLLEKSEGEVFIHGKKVNRNSGKEVKMLLRNEIGYLFQNYALIDDKTVRENLLIVTDRKKRKQTQEIISSELESLRLDEGILDKKVFQLSGGEQQRIAILRLILHKSRIILADEPTGSLDEQNAEIVLEKLKGLHAEGKTIIMVSHDQKALSYCAKEMILHRGSGQLSVSSLS